MDNLTKAAIIYHGEGVETIEEAKARLLGYSSPIAVEAAAFAFDLGYKYDGVASPEMIAEFRASPHGNPKAWVMGLDPEAWKYIAELWMESYRFYRERM
jgi:hypothetical protein